MRIGNDVGPPFGLCQPHDVPAAARAYGFGVVRAEGTEDGALRIAAARRACSHAGVTLTWKLACAFFDSLGVYRASICVTN